LRYCARPPLSLERLSTTPEGLVAYRLRKPWSADQTHRVMTPLEVMARLAALVPPPRHPLIRFHGVCAPHSSWRGSVVPERIAADSPASGSLQTAAAPDRDTEQPQAEGGSGRAPVAPHTDRPGSAGTAAQSAVSVVQTRAASDACGSTPEKSCGLRATLTAFAASSSYIDWAELLKRVYDVDALACPCGGRLSFIALVTEEETAQTILESMGLPSTPPPLARARSPDLGDPIPPDW